MACDVSPVAMFCICICKLKGLFETEVANQFLSKSSTFQADPHTLRHYPMIQHENGLQTAILGLDFQVISKIWMDWRSNSDSSLIQPHYLHIVKVLILCKFWPGLSASPLRTRAHPGPSLHLQLDGKSRTSWPGQHKLKSNCDDERLES